jgi:hypothetical protein
MKPRTVAALAGAGLALLIAALVVWDILVVTDQERIEAFADTVTSEVNAENIELALAYVNPSVQPVLIEVRHQSLRYDKESPEEFAAMAHGRLRPYHGTKQHVMRKSVEVQETRATVATETFSRRGRVSVDWELKKRGDDWLVSRMAIR